MYSASIEVGSGPVGRSECLPLFGWLQKMDERQQKKMEHHDLPPPYACFGAYQGRQSLCPHIF